MKKYKCMDCLTSFEAEYKEDCPSCGDASDVIEVSAHTDELSVEKLQEQLNTAKKALKEISKTKDFYRSGYDHWEEFSQGALKAQKALAEIGGNDE